MAFLNRLRSEDKAIRAQLTELVVYSEGAFAWSEVWAMCPNDRETAAKTINDYNQLKSGKSKNEYL